MTDNDSSDSKDSLAGESLFVRQAWCAAYDDRQVQSSHVWLEERKDELEVTITSTKPVRLIVNGEQFQWREGQTLLGG